VRPAALYATGTRSATGYAQLRVQPAELRTAPCPICRNWHSNSLQVSDVKMQAQGFRLVDEASSPPPYQPKAQLIVLMAIARKRRVKAAYT
jgi:hypothetical protein